MPYLLKCASVYIRLFALLCCISIIVCKSHKVSNFCICPSVQHKSRFLEGQKPHKSRPLEGPKTTQIKNFASPALTAMYAAHQAKCLIDTSAVHRPEPVRTGQHVPAEDVGFAHSPATDADGVSEDMNG